jgi:hypothetical protein
MLRVGPFYIIPALHNTLEVAQEVRRAFITIKPDAVAVELPEAYSKEFLAAASRLPDISAICIGEEKVYLSEPCDGSFEALRSALEARVPAFAIDLDVSSYPEIVDRLPDPYAIYKIGLEKYFKAIEFFSRPEDTPREEYMAKRLKELSYSYGKILVVIGMSHVNGCISHLDDATFSSIRVNARPATLYTLSDECCREVMAECGYFSLQYEEWRKEGGAFLDRAKLILQLLKAAKAPYEAAVKCSLPPWCLATIMKFCRNLAHLSGALLPDLYQLITAAKACVDHNYAYEVWKLATDWPYLRNIDNLQERKFKAEEIWGRAKKIHFHKKLISQKSLLKDRHKNSKQEAFTFSPGEICSFQPEDLVVEKFSSTLKKRGRKIVGEEDTHTVPFAGSLEEGIDIKETIRHLAERKLFVKKQGHFKKDVGSIVIIFDEDFEKYSWKLTWLGEGNNESDMAFFATPLGGDIVGPGIARCQYGGFFLSYPSRRLVDVWKDPDYRHCETPSEVLLQAACDYSINPVIVFMAKEPPSKYMKQYARRFAKRILFIPLMSMNATSIQKLKSFHVLDSRLRRATAEDYIS